MLTTTTQVVGSSREGEIIDQASREMADLEE